MCVSVDSRRLCDVAVSRDVGVCFLLAVIREKPPWPPAMVAAAISSSSAATSHREEVAVCVIWCVYEHIS